MVHLILKHLGEVWFVVVFVFCLCHFLFYFEILMSSTSLINVSYLRSCFSLRVVCLSVDSQITDTAGGQGAVVNRRWCAAVAAAIQSIRPRRTLQGEERMR